MRRIIPSDRPLASALLGISDVAVRTALYNQLVASAISTVMDLLDSTNTSGFMVFAEVCQSSTLTASYQSTSATPSIDYKYDSLSDGSSSSSVSHSLLSTPSTIINQQSSDNAVVNMLVKPAKVCPDFKDDADQVACCESRIDKDSFFCCTSEQKAHLQWELNKAAWRQFAQDHLPSIIFGCLFLVLFLLILTTFLCKRFTFCPLYRQKSLRSGREIFPQNTHHRYSFATGRYHRPFPTTGCNSLISTTNSAYPSTQPLHFQQQAASIIHKTPAMYEAPPPYELISSMSSPLQPPSIQNEGNTQRPLVRLNNAQRAHELDCLLENEVNNIHQSVITENRNAN